MIQVCRVEGKSGRWTWQIGRVALASSYLTESEPGLHMVKISGIHRQGPERFATHARAEALLTRHLGCEVSYVTSPAAQTVALARDASWHKLERADPPERERDSYAYLIGNVLIASLTNLKSIRESGYHLYLPLASGSETTRVATMGEGERLLADALACAVSIHPRGASYALGANHQPAEAAWFSCQPTLYDGRPGW